MNTNNPTSMQNHLEACRNQWSIEVQNLARTGRRRSPKFFRFIGLLAELRIAVYNETLHENDTRIPMPAYFREYRSILLSCKQFKDEFEHEWATAFNVSVNAILSTWPFPQTTLRMVPVSKFADANNAQIVFSRDLRAALRESVFGSVEAAGTMFQKPQTDLPSITFRPNAAAFPPLDGSVDGFLSSSQYFWLFQFRHAVLERCCDMTGLNYWREELWWRRPAGPITAARNLGTPLFVGLLPEITKRICEVFVESCDTMEELREYRALFMPC
jgi:hypothetical protein